MRLPEGAAVHLDTATYRLWTVDKWLPFKEAEELLHHVRCSGAVKLDKHPKVIMWGKEMHMRRSVGFFSNAPGITGYRYSGQETETRPLTPPLAALLDATNAALGTAFNGLLINPFVDFTPKCGGKISPPAFSYRVQWD